MLPIVMEILAYLPQAIQLGMDVTAIVQRAIALYEQPTPATPDQLQELQAAIVAEKQKLADMTAQLDTDPPAA